MQNCGAHLPSGSMRPSVQCPVSLRISGYATAIIQYTYLPLYYLDKLLLSVYHSCLLKYFAETKFISLISPHQSCPLADALSLSVCGLLGLRFTQAVAPSAEASSGAPCPVALSRRLVVAQASADCSSSLRSREKLAWWTSRSAGGAVSDRDLKLYFPAAIPPSTDRQPSSVALLAYPATPRQRGYAWYM